MNKSLTNSKRRIDVVGDELILYVPQDGITEYFTYNELLLQILMHDNIRIKRTGDGKRLRLAVCKNGEDHHFYGHDLAYAAYHGFLAEETYLEDLDDFREYKNENNLHIDHADNFVHNNTILNLSLMDADLNRRKGSIVTQFKNDSGIASIYYNGNYRIWMEYVLTLEDTMKLLELAGDKIPIGDIVKVGAHVPMKLRCDNAEEYVECIEWLSRFKFNGKYICRDENGKLSKRYDHNTYKGDMNAQTLLSVMPEEAFLPFKGSKSHGEAEV